MDIKLYNNTYNIEENLDYEKFSKRIKCHFLYFKVYQIDFNLYNIEINKDDDVINISHLNKQQTEEVSELLLNNNYFDMSEEYEDEDNNV